MRKKAFYVLLITVLAILVLTFIAKISASSQVCIKDTCFTVDLSKNPIELEKGLMFVESMPELNGMLFIFPKSGIYPFWMKNTLIPLDIIWINENNQIIHISKQTPTCQVNPCPTFSSENESLYVLEINSGLSDKFNITVGDKVSFSKI